MGRDPLTFEGALAILGHHDRPWLKKLDGLLGGVILGAGGAAAVATAGPPGLVALGLGKELWGWIDQKNEAIKLLGSALDRLSARRLKVKGYERHQLIVAAHTALVIGSFFEALRERLGPDVYKSLELTQAERERIALGEHRVADRPLVTSLYKTGIPAPGPALGFVDNLPLVSGRLNLLAYTTESFIEGLAAGERLRLRSEDVAARALERYRSRYLELADTVREFEIWALLGEHAATRTKVDEVRIALARIEELLRPDDAEEEMPARRAAVRNANQDGLSASVVAGEDMGPAGDLVFPVVEDIYVNPRCRLAVYSDKARPADKSWWDGQPIHDDLDVRLAAQVIAPNAMHQPMLMLGHPGAGKSLTAKVLAARLPAESYTVVRVPLRHVVADAPIYKQISTALDLATQGRVTDWSQLAEESADTIRVVILDGLDELLQAVGHGQSYLDQVVEFQRNEIAQGKPVVVVVTARVVVADQISIPDGTVLLKLEEFEDGHVSAWLNAWRDANAPAIDAGRVGELTLERARRYPDLSAQPLLLLMLAIYFGIADDASPLEDVLVTDLYGRLLRIFSHREAARDRTADAEAVEEHVWRLSVAAFAMFNRGAQDVADAELGADLAALRSGEGGHPDELGRRLLGRFFFVHASEARIRDRDPHLHTYEFLHATFAEFLIAERVVLVLDEIAEAAFGGRYSREPDDALLFALLSHQPLAIRMRTLEFARELFARIDPDGRDRILRALEVVIAQHRCRAASDRYTAYRPTPVDRIRELATYSANLVLLRVLLEPVGTPVPLSKLVPAPRGEWDSMPDLWRSGLDTGGWHAVLAAIVKEGGTLRAAEERDSLSMEFVDILWARLAGDAVYEERLRYGFAIRDRQVYTLPGDQWINVMRSSLLSTLHTAPGEPLTVLLVSPTNSPAIEDRDEIQTLLGMIIRQRLRQFGPDHVRKLVEYALELGEYSSPDPYALAMATARYPNLLQDLPTHRGTLARLYKGRLGVLVSGMDPGLASGHWSARRRDPVTLDDNMVIWLDEKRQHVRS